MLYAVLRYRYSLLAGAFAAGGSFFGKLQGFLRSQQLLQLHQMPETRIFLEFTLLWLLPLVLMVLCNLLNWRYFLRALQSTEQTLTTTVLTAASNYIISFLLGAFFYREHISLLGVLGSTLIVLGLWFLCDGQEKNQTNKFRKC